MHVLVAVLSVRHAAVVIVLVRNFWTPHVQYGGNLLRGNICVHFVAAYVYI